MCPTGKRVFSSESHARRACRSMSNRFRVYRCHLCRQLHVTSEVVPDRKRVA